MKAWKFSTGAFAPAERALAWREAMHRLGLPVGDLPQGEPPSASVTCLTSALGIEFALIDAGAQTITGRRTDLPAAIWLAVLLEGEARVESEGLDQDMLLGDIAFGPTGRAATLILSSRCRILLIRAPRVALDHRLIAARSVKVGRLDANQALVSVFSNLLRATAAVLGDMTVDQLRPVELALTEFLAAALAEKMSADAHITGGASPHLQRICQTIETLLPEPDLSLTALARKCGVSPRYVQKLFATAEDTFGHYLRVRRLERCRMDLGSPMCASLSISEICYRWGFNDSAHFSRAFRQQYHVSPREYRRDKAAESTAAAQQAAAA